jgi:myo-inositol-1(or 4)-monophosphatase
MAGTNPDNPDAGELLELAVGLARDAAALIRVRPDDLGADTKATPTDAVTVTDRAAERLILAGLAAARPQDGVVAEESGTTSGTAPTGTESGPTSSSTVRWYVDPLDGTVNYLYDLPQYAVSIAAEVDGNVVAGVVLDVATADEYTAVRGAGAYCNGRRLTCRSESDPALSLVATGFSYDAARRASQAETLRSILPRVRDIRRMGAAALDLCALAAGRVDGYYEERLKPWDWAAGALIAAEAGARVGTVGGGPLATSIALAANPVLYEALEGLLAAASMATEAAAEAGTEASTP